MAERDFLHTLLTQLSAGQSVDTKAPPMPPHKETGAMKLGVKQPPREVAKEAGALPFGVPQKKAKAPHAAKAPATSDAAQEAEATQKGPAFKAAYFNRDVAAVREVNLAARGAQALRGEDGAMDLKRVVLPLPARGDGPTEPVLIESALTRMALPDSAHASAFSQFIERQWSWSQLPSVTHAHIVARQKVLAAMVELRRAALARMRASQKTAAHVPATLARALHDKNTSTEGGLDAQATQEAGDTMISSMAESAQALATRLEKVLRTRR